MEMARVPIIGSSTAPPTVNTHKKNERSLSPTHTQQRNEHMKRVSVVERICGCPLYDQVWDWRVADQTKPSSVSGLIHFFLKFGDNFKNIALESGKRDSVEARDERVQRVQKVVFDQTPVTATKVRYGHYESIRRRKKTESEASALLMFFAYDDRCTACAFVTKELEDTGAALAEAILEQFTTKYAANLARLESEFEHEAKNPDESLVCERFLGEFESFGKVVEVLTGEAHATTSGESRRRQTGRLGRSVTTSSLELSKWADGIHKESSVSQQAAKHITRASAGDISSETWGESFPALQLQSCESDTSLTSDQIVRPSESLVLNPALQIHSASARGSAKSDAS